MLAVSGRLDGLAGTWRGEVETSWHIKGTGVARSGSFPCFKTLHTAGSDVTLRWLFEVGVAYAAGLQFVPVGSARRLICLYESTRPGGTSEQAPSHRGAWIVDIDRDRPLTLEGPYFTDRRTSGTLRFGNRWDAQALSYAQAVDLYAV